MFLTTKALLPLMLSHGSGSIINIASVSALAGEMNLISYGTSKAAVVQLTRSTATQYGKLGIRANAIAPAVVNTRNVEIYGTQRGEEIYTRAMATPHVALPQDVANAVFFLGSDESRMITGQVLCVDGGLTGSQSIAADYRDWYAEQGRVVGELV